MDEELYWKTIKPKVEALITQRIIVFHDGLVRDGQIPPHPKPSHPTEIESSVEVDKEGI